MTFKISSCPVGTNVICEKLARRSVVAYRATVRRAPTSLARPLPAHIASRLNGVRLSGG
jgi:hypothetical protein